MSLASSFASACRHVAASLLNSRLCMACLFPVRANAKASCNTTSSISAGASPNSSKSFRSYLRSLGASPNWLQQSLIVIIDSVTWTTTVANVMALETTPTTSAIAIKKQVRQIQEGKLGIRLSSYQYRRWMPCVAAPHAPLLVWSLTGNTLIKYYFQ